MQSVDLVNTTKGMIPLDTLSVSEGSVDNDHEFTTWKEYRLDDEIVRRDVHVTVKKTVSAFADNSTNL